MNIVLPDGSVKELEEGATVADVAASIGAGLARAALAGIVNDTPVDLDAVVSDGDSVAIVTAKSDEGLGLMRHSTAHLLAAALTDMYPGVKFGVGPAIENGFYYDIELPEGVTVSPDDFAASEARMAEIAKSGAAIVRREVSRDEAREIFTDQPLKLELIDELPEDETISIYQLGDFTDLCRGPHVPDTGKLGAYKLTKVAGAYWKGDSDNAPAHLRHGVLQQKGAGRVPAQPGGGREARPPQARARAGHLHDGAHGRRGPAAVPP